jgi:hypothetical protein
MSISNFIVDSSIRRRLRLALLFCPTATVALFIQGKSVNALCVGILINHNTVDLEAATSEALSRNKVESMYKRLSQMFWMQLHFLGIFSYCKYISFICTLKDKNG